MSRSTGITVSAVVVIIGSTFTVLCGAMMVLASFLALNSNRAADAPVNLRYILGIEAVVTFAFGGWGLASGIGLLKTKEWAGISTLVYAAILVFISLPNRGLVTLSVLIAVLSSYAALDLVGRVRAVHGVTHHLWLISGGATMMGIGIWSMPLQCRLKNPAT
jgi:hypothetical protein